MSTDACKHAREQTARMGTHTSTTHVIGFRVPAQGLGWRPIPERSKCISRSLLENRALLWVIRGSFTYLSDARDEPKDGGDSHDDHLYTGEVGKDEPSSMKRQRWS